MKIRLLLFLFTFICSPLFSQYLDLSPKAEISVLTIGPGNSLNDSFGHSAFRVKDNSSDLDIIFNYGVYDFEAENFYLKFARGKLNYIVDVSNYENFKNYYIRQNRWIKEQVLDLSENDKQKVFNYLANNSEPENKYYLYDFFYDNCATKMKDILVDGVGLNIGFIEPDGFEAYTFRQLIQEKLHWNSWGSLGIDIALGSVIDKTADPEEHMFLPDYIFSFFENAGLAESDKKPLVKATNSIFDNTIVEKKNNLLSSPFVIISLIGVLMILITFRDHKKNERTRIIDLFIFLLTGISGVVLLLLWLATDHTATAQNYNLLWAFAINIFLIGQVFKKKPKKWFIRYLKFLVIMLCLLLLQWIAGIQGFAFALIPLLLALVIRYLFLIKHFNKINSTTNH